MHFAHEGQNDHPDNGATENNLQVRAAPFVRRLSLCTPDKNDQGQGDGEEQNYSWHVTEGSYLMGLLGSVSIMISVLVPRYGPFSNCSSSSRSPAAPLSLSAFSPPRAKRATAPKSCRKRSALLASNGTVAPPLT